MIRLGGQGTWLASREISNRIPASANARRLPSGRFLLTLPPELASRAHTAVRSRLIVCERDTPAVARQCIFWGGTNLTVEDAIPPWIFCLLLKDGDQLGIYVHQRRGTEAPQACLRRTGRRIEVRVKQVCGTCNSGRMSTLEAAAKPVLTPMLLGQPIRLSGSAQLIVAKWAVKTAVMFAGRRLAYADYLGYDEVAHHAGPSTGDARHVLRKMEGQLRQLESAAKRAPRRYGFVVLSDHGQSTGATFRQRYGLTLDQLVHRLIVSEYDVQMASEAGEGSGQLHALMTEAIRVGGAIGRTAHGLFRRTSLAGADHSTRVRARAEQADVVLSASGNLGLVYFARSPGRLSMEAIERAHPGLLDQLVRALDFSSSIPS
jgi:hypothetical protein